jgi:hypothetical protein
LDILKNREEMASDQVEAMLVRAHQAATMTMGGDRPARLNADRLLG